MRALRFVNNLPNGVLFVDPSDRTHSLSLKSNFEQSKITKTGQSYSSTRDTAIMRIATSPTEPCPGACPGTVQPVINSVKLEVYGPTLSLSEKRQLVVDTFSNYLLWFDNGGSSGMPPNFTDVYSVDNEIEINPT